MSNESKFVVFNCWQSDLPDETNRLLIREGLQAARNELELEFKADGLRVEIDEATRGLAGSPNIPMAILNKVRAADAFVADITTTCSPTNEEIQPSPNPNVMVELGYALAMQGWNRIVMLFNKAHGKFPDDVPFDIDRQRISDFEFALPSVELTKRERAEQNRKAKEPLFRLLHEALRAIYLQRPSRPIDEDEVAPEIRQRQRDVETLNELLEQIHLPTMDEFFDSVPTGGIPHNIFHFWESFHAVFKSALFHVYDSEAQMLVSRLHDDWGKSLSFGDYFRPSSNGKSYRFIMPGDVFQSKRDEKAWKDLQAACKGARDTFALLLAHVRENYVEIDIKRTSKSAWQNFVAYHDVMKKRFGPI